MGTPHVVSAARDFAVNAHGDQLYADQPYAGHLDEVAVLVQPYGDDHQTVAYLHHVLEGTGATIEQVDDAFGTLVSRCVGALTDAAVTDAKTRNAIIYPRLGQIGPDDDRVIALVIAAADRLVEAQRYYLDEQRGKLRKLRRDHRDFRGAAYRPGIADELWTELNDIIGS